MNHIRTHLRELAPSDTLLINERSKALEASGKIVFKFGFGQSPFPVPEIVQSTLKENVHQKAYLPVRGLDELRGAIATHMNMLVDGAKFQKENIFAGPGSKELMFLTQVSLDLPLLLPNPSWVSYAPQAIIGQNQIHWIPTDLNDWKLNASILEKYLDQNNIAKGILLINYPCNPSGAELSNNELSDLAQVCRNHNLIVISDEIYGLLAFDDQYKSIASYYPEGTIISTGLSKWCGAGGYRFGTYVIPDELSYVSDILATLASETFSAVSAPIQYAAVTAYQPHPELKQYRNDVISILKIVANYCHEQLSKLGVHIIPSTGGFYLFPNFAVFRDRILLNGMSTSKDFCERLLQETGVALLPGSAFGRPVAEMSARLSYVDFDGDQALDYWNSNKHISVDQFEVLFPNIVSGITGICDWLKALKY